MVEKERDERIWGNCDKKLGLKRILCGSQVTIPDTGGTSTDLAFDNSNARSFKPNQASDTPHLSYQLVSSK